MVCVCVEGMVLKRLIPPSVSVEADSLLRLLTQTQSMFLSPPAFK